MRKYINWLIVILIILGCIAFYNAKQDILQNRDKNPVEGDFGTGNAELDTLIDKLALCESGGRENFRIVDSNGWFSYATFQFQMPTWKAYAAEVFTEADDADLENLIWGGSDQRKVVEYMLTTNPNNWRHWYTCSKKIGLDDWAARQ